MSSEAVSVPAPGRNELFETIEVLERAVRHSEISMVELSERLRDCVAEAYRRHDRACWTKKFAERRFWERRAIRLATVTRDEIRSQVRQALDARRRKKTKEGRSVQATA